MGHGAFLTRVRFEIRRARRDQAGSGLVLALFVMALLTGVGVVLLSIMQTEMRMSQVDQRTKKAFYLAEAGTQYGREILSRKVKSSGNPSLTPELVEGSGANHTIDVRVANIRPQYNASGVFTGLAGVGDDKPLVAKTALGGGWYYAFVTDDPIDGRTNTVDAPPPNPGHGRAIVVGVGVGPGRSFEVAETLVLLRDELVDFPATVTLPGPNPVYHPGPSMAKELSGDDCDDPSLWVPVVGVANSAVASTRAGVDPKDKPNDTMVTGAGGSVTGLPTIQGVDATMDATIGSCEGLRTLAGYVKASADYVGDASGAISNLGTPAARKIVFVNGDLALSGSGSYAGVLWVTGTLTIKGNITWNGPIFVVGKGKFLTDGGGQALFMGANVVANIAGPDGIVGTTDDCTGTNFGQATFDFSGGGNHTTKYCLREIRKSFLGMPLKPLAFRQH